MDIAEPKVIDVYISKECLLDFIETKEEARNSSIDITAYKTNNNDITG